MASLSVAFNVNNILSVWLMSVPGVGCGFSALGGTLSLTMKKTYLVLFVLPDVSLVMMVILYSPICVVSVKVLLNNCRSSISNSSMSAVVLSG